MEEGLWGDGAADTVECWWTRVRCVCVWGAGDRLGFQLGHLAAVLLWVCYLTSLSLTDLIYTMGIIIFCSRAFVNI